MSKDQFAPCAHHRPVKLDYLAWHAWAEKQRKAGIRQRLCPKCMLWLFPEEFGTEPAA